MQERTTQGKLTRRMMLCLAPAGVLGAAGSALAAGSADDPEDGAFRIVSDTELVVVDVGVHDQHGGFVRGLGKSNFRVDENGQQRPITFFSAGQQPITIGLVIDHSASMQDKWNDVLTAAKILMSPSGLEDQFFLVTFADRALVNLAAAKSPRDGASTIYRTLTGLPLGGRTALYDGIAAGLQQLQNAGDERKALVVISDGGDNASIATRMATLEAVERSLATIYTIGIFDSSDQDANPGFLRRLAQKSGGGAFFPKEPAALPAIANRIVADIRARYTVGFSPADTHLDNTVRNFRVSVSNGNASRKWRVHARSQYLASSDSLPKAGGEPR